MHEPLARREFLRVTLAGTLGVSSSGWLPALAESLAQQGGARRHCVLLWMSGGPSQLDTFDLKPGHANGGSFGEIATAVPGLRWSEHLPSLARWAERLAVIRGVSTREGDHQRGTYLMRTGQRPGTPIRFPCIGSALAKALSVPQLPLPDYFSINPASQISPDAFGPGFLGPKYAAATVGSAAPADAQTTPEAFAELRVDNLTPPENIAGQQRLARLELWDRLQQDFLATRPAAAVVAQDTVYRRAVEMMQSDHVQAFDLSREPDQVRAAYGRGRFGQGCLLARRLIEQGVPIVEVTLGEGLAWDTHQDNFATVRRLSEELDQGWSTLMSELQERGLLDSTTILWMGEFGRTPQINSMTGRDHFPNAWTCVLAGGGIAGGQAFGTTSADGMEVIDGKVAQGDVLATLCAALGVDPTQENISEQGRPHKIADGTPIRQILA
jgi:uncharacterized protein (DUF1501 family)